MTCGGGSQTRLRSCGNPPSQLGVDDCLGMPSESQPCNTNICPGEGLFLIELGELGWLCFLLHHSILYMNL